MLYFIDMYVTPMIAQKLQLRAPYIGVDGQWWATEGVIVPGLWDFEGDHADMKSVPIPAIQLCVNTYPAVMCLRDKFQWHRWCVDIGNIGVLEIKTTSIENNQVYCERYIVSPDELRVSLGDALGDAILEEEYIAMLSAFMNRYALLSDGPLKAIRSGLISAPRVTGAAPYPFPAQTPFVEGVTASCYGTISTVKPE